MYGVPVGSDRYCAYKLQIIAERIISDARQTVDLLAADRQSLWSALRLSIAQRFDYWLQTSYPSVVKPIAVWLDKELWKVLESATGLKIPRGASDNSWNCTLPMPVVGRDGLSFQEWIVRLPVKLGGFGFRSLEDTAGIAFIGAMEQAIPLFCGENGICPQLTEVVGGSESFGDDADSNLRWSTLLESGCREGVELKTVWSALQEEESQAAGWLDKDRQENLTQDVAGIGGHSTDGSTRGKITEERDKTRAKCISKGLACQEK